MSILEQFLEAIEYRINDAWEHQWASYTNGQTLSSSNQFGTMSVVFDRETQTVIEITATTELEARKQCAYRWMNPDFKDAIYEEAGRRNVSPTEAFERMDYIDLEVVEDVLEKGKAILADEEFDERVQVPLDLDSDVLLELMIMAHNRDITFNQLIEEALLKVIAETQPNNSAE